MMIVFYTKILYGVEMLVALFVYFASYFGYVITDNEVIQEEKNILLKESSLTFAPGAVLRSEVDGGNSVTLRLGYEKQFTPYERNWAFQTQYVFASEARSIVDQIGNFKNRDHYITAGISKYFGDKKFIYLNAGPYFRREKVYPAVTLGAGVTMSAFGGGFKPNAYIDCLKGGCQFGMFANFDID
jgi:hypothetical protein